MELERRLASASNVPFSASEVRAVELREGSNGLSGLGAYEGIEKQVLEGIGTTRCDS